MGPCPDPWAGSGDVPDAQSVARTSWCSRDVKPCVGDLQLWWFNIQRPEAMHVSFSLFFLLSEA